ncbi:MAG: hypothetical protein EOO02_01895 [Chitinophagaceae bacterium]|nr:MAG: hypothetical protein EOO02_01895 [Chitinophagaceae bacterium]
MKIVSIEMSVSIGTEASVRALKRDFEISNTMDLVHARVVMEHRYIELVRDLELTSDGNGNNLLIDDRQAEDGLVKIFNENLIEVEASDCEKLGFTKEDISDAPVLTEECDEHPNLYGVGFNVYVRGATLKELDAAGF